MTQPQTQARTRTAIPTPTIEQIMDLTAGIPITKRVLREALDDATAAERRFIGDLLAAEHASRAASKKARLIRQARFPTHKTFDGYDYSLITWPADWGRKNLHDLDFITNHEDIVCYGDVGTGKTHLAIATGYAACHAGYSVRFFTAASLIALLREATEKGTLDRAVAQIGKTDLIIIDEFGYLPIDHNGARLLYQIIANAYETQSIIYTTNLEFSRWPTIIGDATMAAAIIDRTVHYGRILRFEGTSWRLDHATMK